MSYGRYCVLLACLLVVGCAGPSAYKRVFKDKKQEANSKVYAVTFDDCWHAVKRALLALNFSIDDEQPEQGLVKASRYFQDRKRTTSIAIRMDIEPLGVEETAVYASAVQTREKIYLRSHRRFFLWVIPLPGGGGTEASRVIEAQQTIEDPKFYQGIFAQVEEQIEKLSTAAPEETIPSATQLEPAPQES